VEALEDEISPIQIDNALKLSLFYFIISAGNVSSKKKKIIKKFNTVKAMKTCFFFLIFNFVGGKWSKEIWKKKQSLRSIINQFLSKIFMILPLQIVLL